MLLRATYCAQYPVFTTLYKQHKKQQPSAPPHEQLLHMKQQVAEWLPCPLDLRQGLPADGAGMGAPSPAACALVQRQGYQAALREGPALARLVSVGPQGEVLVSSDAVHALWRLLFLKDSGCSFPTRAQAQAVDAAHKAVQVAGAKLGSW